MLDIFWGSEFELALKLPYLQLLSLRPSKMRSFHRIAVRQLSRLQHPSTRSFSVARHRCSQPSPSQTAPAAQPLPYVYKCPEPTCSCLPTPSGLDIDHKSPLLNTMAPYSEQLVICSGQDDWSSRIEDETSPAGDFLRGVKSIIGKGGEAFDVGTLAMLPRPSPCT